MPDSLVKQQNRLSNHHSMMIRFLPLSILIFLFFLFISFFILSRYRNSSLDQKFGQIYRQATSVSEQKLNENLRSLVRLSLLPSFSATLASYAAGDNSSVLPPVTDGRGVPVILISESGIVISGPKPWVTGRKFRYFNDLSESSDKGRTNGFFTSVMPGSGISPSLIIFYYSVVKSPDNRILGYLVSQLRYNLMLNPVRNDSTGLSSGVFSKRVYNSDISGFPDLYFVSEDGNPMTHLLYEKEYHGELSARGFHGNYYDFPLMNIFSEIPEDSLFLEKKYIENEETKSFLRIYTPYRNYINKKVFGAVYYIKEMNLYYVIEFDVTSINSPYLKIFLLIFFLLFFCILVFLFLLNQIDRLRIKSLDANPLTYLPGNYSINQQIQYSILKKADVAIVYGDLDNFKAYNDAYGFSMGDRVIKFTADILKKSLSHQHNCAGNFCGHIGGDDFLFIVPSSKVKEISDNIGKSFESGIRSFYNKEHLKMGCIQAKDRSGTMKEFPLISFSMAGLILSRYNFTHFLEVANLCGEVKKLAKKTPGSVLVLDRRHGSG